MAAVASSLSFRGVHCRHCGKAIRVPGIVLRKDNESQSHHETNDSHFHLISRVFVVRCRSCEREGIYSISQIVDCSCTQSAAQTALHQPTI